MHARRRHVGETLAVESVQHALVLCVVQRQGWARTWRARALRPGERAMASVGAGLGTLARGSATPKAHGGAGSRVAQDWGRVRVPQPSWLVVVQSVQQHGKFFLDPDHQHRLVELALKAIALTRELGDLQRLGAVGCDLGATLLWC